MREQNIVHVKIATASPQANWQAERMNRTIIAIIAKLADKQNFQWYDTLEKVEFVCNNTVNRSTGESPSVLMYGTQQRGQVIDDLKDTFEATEEASTDRDLIAKREKAAEQIKKQSETNKRNFYKKRKPAQQYEVGNRIMIRNFEHGSNTAKLVPEFKGP